MGRYKIKPSKGQSTAGLIGGMIFVGIGIFVIIPSAGLFGIVWTLFAVIITIINGVNAFSNKGIAMYDIITDTHSQTNEDLDFEVKLRKLESLKSEGLISQEEYERKRHEILDDKW